MKKIRTSKLKFISATATNTRLMGVVGVVVHWMDEAERKIVQIFHLDFEVYGIDGFYHLIEPKTKELSELVLAVTGGLGGQFVNIDFRELVYLLKSSYQVDVNSIEAHVDFDAYIETFLSWKSDLSRDEISALMDKLTPHITSDEHVINYLMMRLVGNDLVSTMNLWDIYDEQVNLEPFDGPRTLIKNTSTLVSNEGDFNTYRVEALVDFEHKYKLLVYKVMVRKSAHLIHGLSFLEALVIGSIEASFNLNKPEYILVSHIKDSFFERRFSENNPEMMKQTYEQGQLFIEFNQDNNHVSQNPYYLNGDIYALYFFSKADQLLIGSFSHENIEEIDAMLIENLAYEESLQFICELKTDDPILYAYINSQYETIFDFLSQ